MFCIEVAMSFAMLLQHGAKEESGRRLEEIPEARAACPREELKRFRESVVQPIW